jgi:hypothetical protein
VAVRKEQVPKKSEQKLTGYQDQRRESLAVSKEQQVPQELTIYQDQRREWM